MLSENTESGKSPARPLCLPDSDHKMAQPPPKTEDSRESGALGVGGGGGEGTVSTALKVSVTGYDTFQTGLALLDPQKHEALHASQEACLVASLS